MEDLGPILLGVAWKASVTAVVLLLVSKVGERLGPFMASIVMAFPMNAGPGYFFLAMTEEPQFMAAGALPSLAGTGAVFMFIPAYVHVASRWGGFVLPMLAGIASWSVGAFVIAQIDLTMTWAFALTAAGAAIAVLFSRKFDFHSVPKFTRVPFRFMVLRAVVGGTIVAVAATLANIVGPYIAGMAFAFPTTICATMWMMTRLFGATFAAATIQSARLTMINYITFCAVLYISAQHVTSMQAWTIAIIAPMFTSAGLALFGHRAKLRAAAKHRSDQPA